MNTKEKDEKRSRGFYLFLVLLIAGAVLVISACGMLFVKRMLDKQAVLGNEEVVGRMRGLLPDGGIGFLEEGEDPRMPTIEIGGVNYLGRISVERFGVDRAVTSEWNERSASAFFGHTSGSLYDKSLVVGARNDAGQFSFFYEIDKGDKVRFIDAEGVTYVYIVKSAARKSSFDPSARTDADLTLYLYNSLSMEYIVLYCGTAE